MSAEELFAEWGYKGTRTEEEKEEARFKIRRQMAMSQMLLCHAIEQYLGQADK